MQRWTTWIVCLVAMLVLPASGCSDAVVVSERVTRDYGDVLVSDTEGIALRPGATALDLLQREHDVALAPADESVAAIDGIRGGGEEGPWALIVNGVFVDLPPAEYELSDGDVVQWDLGGPLVEQASGATVGAYPEPFLEGVAGREVHARVGCVGAAPACDRVEDSLHDAGVVLRDVDSIDAEEAAAEKPSNGPFHAEILVGPWHHLASHPLSRRLIAGPGRSGVFVRVLPGPERLHYGDKLQILDSRGEIVRTLGRSGSVVVAMRPGANSFFWLVTGVDWPGTERAAQALIEGELRDSYAAAITPDGVYPVP
jgi:hypothetical protein